jgi:hypothetical protein
MQASTHAPQAVRPRGSGVSQGAAEAPEGPQRTQRRYDLQLNGQGSDRYAQLTSQMSVF